MIITCPKCSAKYKIPAEISLKQAQKMQCSACQNIFKFQGEVPDVAPEKMPLIPPKDAVLSVHSKMEKVVIHQREKKKGASDAAILPEVFLPIQVKEKKSSLPIFGIVFCSLLLIVLALIGWNYRDLLLSNTPSDISYSRPLARRKHATFKRKERPAPVVYSDDIPLFEEETKTHLSTEENFSVQSVRFRKTPTGDALLIEGALKNVSAESMVLPEKIYALGYGADGKVLFEKEIHLASGILYPNMEQSFFGTYPLKGEEVQWVEVVLEK